MKMIRNKIRTVELYMWRNLQITMQDRLMRVRIWKDADTNLATCLLKGYGNFKGMTVEK